jgi:hypothetical protein
MEKQRYNIHKHSEFIKESVETFKWHLVHQDKKLVAYEFNDHSGNEYRVENIIKGKVAESFWYVKDKNGNWSVSEITNAGNVFKLTHTIYGEILPNLFDITDINKVIITGVGKTLERDYITQRTKLYYRFLKNNLSDRFNTTQIGNRIFVTR